MARSNPAYYIAPSAISITPNANGSENDLAVYIARGATIKVFSPRAGIDYIDGEAKSWALSGRNRRLADSTKPYTIYARLSKNDENNGYLVFAPKILRGEEWVDSYSSVILDGNGYSVLYQNNGFAVQNIGQSYYIRLGEVSLPENGKRTVTIDTGILGTDQYNNDWALNPDTLPLRIDLNCTIDDEDAGPTPYIYWDQRLMLTATLVEGWTGTDIQRFDHWTISRSSGDEESDTAWLTESRKNVFNTYGSIELIHDRDGVDDFNGAVAATFTITAWGKQESDSFDSSDSISSDNELIVLKTAVITIFAETVESYDIETSEALVSYNPETDTYSPADGVRVRIRAKSQDGTVFYTDQAHISTAGLHVYYLSVGEDDSNPIELTFINGTASLPISLFQAGKGINLWLENGAQVVLDRTTVGYVRFGAKGDTPINIYRWYKEGLEPIVPTVTNSDDPAPAGGDVTGEANVYPVDKWIHTTPDRPESGKWALWMCSSIRHADSTRDAWAGPVRISGVDGAAGEDGSDREYIYKRMTTYPFSDILPNNIYAGTVNGKSSTNKKQNDWVPVGWSDNALAATADEKYVYISIREKAAGKNQSWGDFSTPTLWSNWGVQGTDGDGVQYVFKLYDHELSTTERTNYIPMKPAAQNANGEWLPAANNANDPNTTQSWTDDPASTTEDLPYCYCSTIKRIGGTWGDFEVLGLWSKWGQDGADGSGIEQVFARTKTYTAPYILSNPSYNGMNYTDDNYCPLISGADTTYATDAPKGVDATHPYEWVAIRKKVVAADGKKRIWPAYDTGSVKGKMTLWAAYIEGKDATNYTLNPSSFIITEHKDKSITPTHLNIIATKTVGQNASEPFSGFFIALNADGSTLAKTNNDASSFTLTEDNLKSAEYPITVKLFQNQDSPTVLATANVNKTIDGASGEDALEWYAVPAFAVIQQDIEKNESGTLTKSWRVSEASPAVIRIHAYGIEDKDIVVLWKDRTGSNANAAGNNLAQGSLLLPTGMKGKPDANKILITGVSDDTPVQGVISALVRFGTEERVIEIGYGLNRIGEATFEMYGDVISMKSQMDVYEEETGNLTKRVTNVEQTSEGIKQTVKEIQDEQEVQGSKIEQTARNINLSVEGKSRQLLAGTELTDYASFRAAGWSSRWWNYVEGTNWYTIGYDTDTDIRVLSDSKLFSGRYLRSLLVNSDIQDLTDAIDAGTFTQKVITQYKLSGITAADTWYVLSFRCKTGVEGSLLGVEIGTSVKRLKVDGTDVEIANPSTRYVSVPLSDTWTLHEIAFTLGEVTDDSLIRFYQRWREGGASDYVDIGDIQLEEGVNATYWMAQYKGLKETGIDLKNGKITLSGDNVEVEGDLRANSLRTRGVSGGPSIVIEDGIIKIYGTGSWPNWQFGVDESGNAVLDYYDKDSGAKLYSLGPDGLQDITNVASSWESKVFMVYSGSYLTVPSDESWSAMSALMDAGKNASGDVASKQTYWYYHAGYTKTSGGGKTYYSEPARDADPIWSSGEAQQHDGKLHVESRAGSELLSGVLYEDVYTRVIVYGYDKGVLMWRRTYDRKFVPFVIDDVIV